MRFVIAPALLLLLSCVSRTTPLDRVSESLALAPPGDITVGNSTQFSFAMIGDLHVGAKDTSLLVRVLDGAISRGDEFLILLGDVIDQGEDADFEAVKTTLDSYGWFSKTRIVAGNHDVYYDGWNYYKEYFGSSTYTFNAGNSRFIGLDTADGSLGSAQNQWLREQLPGTATHTFVLSHYLPVIPGISTYLKLASETESLDLMSLATRSGVRGWFGAHYHSHVQANIEGVEYVVAGGGGRRMPPIATSFFLRVIVDGDDVTYERVDL